MSAGQTILTNAKRLTISFLRAFLLTGLASILCIIEICLIFGNFQCNNITNQLHDPAFAVSYLGIGCMALTLATFAGLQVILFAWQSKLRWFAGAAVIFAQIVFVISMIALPWKNQKDLSTPFFILLGFMLLYVMILEAVRFFRTLSGEDKDIS